MSKNLFDKAAESISPPQETPIGDTGLNMRTLLTKYLQDLVIETRRINNMADTIIGKLSVKQTVAICLMQLYQEDELSLDAAHDYFEIGSADGFLRVNFKLPSKHKVSSRIKLELIEHLGYTVEPHPDLVVLHPAAGVVA